MNRIKCITYQYSCNSCSRYDSFSEKINICSVKKFECTNFIIIFIKYYDINDFKLKITFVCKSCNKVQHIEFNIGKMSPQNKLITDQTYNHKCCMKSAEVIAFLSEDFLGQSQEGQNNFEFIDDNYFNNILNNNNKFLNDFQNINDLTYNNIKNNKDKNLIIKEVNDSIKNQLEGYNSLNIIEFNKKNRIVSFLDEQNNKIYKIYTYNKIIVKNLLDDLCNNFPEINYNNRKLILKSNNLEVRLDSNIYNFIKDDFSTIVIKNGQ